MTRKHVASWTALTGAVLGIAVLGGCGQPTVATTPAPTVTVTADPAPVAPQQCLNALTDAQALINGNADMVDLLAAPEYLAAVLVDDETGRAYIQRMVEQQAVNDEAANRWHASEVACKALSGEDV